MERKCPKCGTWNKDKKNCSNCGERLDFEKIRKEEEAEKKQNRLLLRKPDILDKWFNQLSQSSNPFVKVFYFIALSVWMVFAVIVGIIILIASLATG